MAGGLPLLSAPYRALIPEARGAYECDGANAPIMVGRRDSFPPSLSRIAIAPVGNAAGTKVAGEKNEVLWRRAPPRPNG